MKTINIDRVEDIITEYGLKTKARNREIIWNRYAAFNFLRSFGFSLSTIGKLFDKDHATVLNGLKVYEKEKRYSDFQSYVLEIEKDLQTTIEGYIFESEDVCVNEVVCLCNLENLIKEKL